MDRAGRCARAAGGRSVEGEGDRVLGVGRAAGIDDGELHRFALGAGHDGYGILRGDVANRQGCALERGRGDYQEEVAIEVGEDVFAERKSLAFASLEGELLD